MGPRKKHRSVRRVALAALAVILASRTVSSLADEPLKPLPPSPRQQTPQVQLGRELFYEARLSANNRVSCSSCHDLKRGGADNRDRSLGFDGKPTEVNAPTVFNAALNFRQFWDGRADSLEAQIDAVVQNPVEMGSRWDEVIAELSQIEHYRRAFGAAYRDGITKANVQNALATYERTLLTPDAPFDKYLRGDAGALSQIQKLGYTKFKLYGCVACHQGVNIGGNMFQKFGVMGDYLAQRPHRSEADLGRYRVTRQDADRNVFKVPSLRNVARTAPYFHDGSASTLEEAVDIMFRYQLGRTASVEDRRAIVAFLESLNGEWKEKP